MTTTRRKRTGRRVVVVVAVVVTTGAAVAVSTGAAAGLWKTDQAEGGKVDLPPSTAPLTRQTLVDTETKSGELGYGDATAVNAGLDGIVTSLPATGTVVERGQALYRVDDTSVVLLYGALPAYRTLAPGTTGADVTQFEQNLSALGYTGFTADDTYTQATATAVRKWQGDLGVTKTGTVDQGRIAHAAGPVRVDALKAAVGDPSRPGAAVLTCSGTVRLITVKLDVSDERLVVPGTAVTVALPNGKPATGKITGSRTVVDPGDGKADPTTKIAVTVTPDDPAALTGLDQASVRVGFTASQRENVLTVPVAALLALPEGGYGVQVVQAGGTRIVAVRTGLFAAGRVEVSGDGLAEGMTVGMPA